MNSLNSKGNVPHQLWYMLTRNASKDLYYQLSINLFLSINTEMILMSLETLMAKGF